MSKDRRLPGWAVRAETLNGKWRKIAWYPDKRSAEDAAHTLNTVSGFPVDEGDGDEYVFDVVKHKKHTSTTSPETPRTSRNRRARVASCNTKNPARDAVPHTLAVARSRI